MSSSEDRSARPSVSGWKIAALISAATAMALLGITLWRALERRSEAGAAKKQVESVVRDYLSRGETAKAAAVVEGFPGDATSLRLDVAAASGPADAAKLLDPIDLAYEESSVANAVAEARLDVYGVLFETRVLRGGALPAPYELKAYRLESFEYPPRAEMSRITSRLLQCISDRRDAARRAGQVTDAGLAETESMAVAARYALGEIPYEDVHPATDEVRFAFGDLLYRERQFDRAVETWNPILDDERVVGKIAELAALRRLAPDRLHLWDYDLDRLLGRNLDVEKRAAERIERLFREARPAVLPSLDRSDPPVLMGIVYRKSRSRDSDEELALDPNRLYLLVDHDQFRLEKSFGKPFVTSAGAVLKLKSAYHGPIRCRLFRVPDFATLEKISDKTLVALRGKLKQVRDWEHEIEPLWRNGGKEKTWTLKVPHDEPGLFVLMAEARYCPVFAVAPYIVTDAGLVQQVARDRILLFAADRVTGDPIPGLPLHGTVTGRYEIRPEDLIPEGDVNASEYTRGFEAGWAGKEEEPDPTPSYRLGRRRAAEFRGLHPDVSVEFTGATGPDGLFEWAVSSAWRRGYRYAVKTETTDKNIYSRVASKYSLGNPPVLKALAYTDRPVYRPGDTVRFKGILRMLDGEGLHPYDGPSAFFEFGLYSSAVFAASRPVSDFGTASGSFVLPRDCARGPYGVRINNGAWESIFAVEDYRKPEYEIVLEHPERVAAGRPLDIRVRVRAFTGEPLPGTQVELSVQSAPASLRVGSTGNWTYGPSGRSRIGWTFKGNRSVTTDAAGRASYRFVTDADAPSRFLVTARARERTRRWIVVSSGFESVGDARGILVEADRASYFPGETAALHFFAEGAVALRVEEQGKHQDPFSTIVRLEGGRGTCKYPVPEKSRSLRVGVRDGDAWRWKEVPVNIVSRPSASGLVRVRLDRSIYRVGETAKLTLESPDPDPHILVTVQTGRIHRVRLVQLKDRKAEVSLRIRDEDVPNVGIAALTVRNDRVDRAKAELIVPPVDRFLTVEIETNKHEYRPGEECRATVRVVDSKGRPVPECELSLGVVDEALYALREDLTPDLRDFFHRYRRPASVRLDFFFEEPLPPFIVWKSPTFVRGQMDIYDVMGGGGGGGGRYGHRVGGKRDLVSMGGGSSDTGNRPPRTESVETPFWNAHLKTGDDGTASVTFPFPEQLASFRFTARGITKDHKVGTVRARAVVRKNFYVRLETPRVLQEGNTVELTGLVHNFTEEPRIVKPALAGPYSAGETDAPEFLTIPPGEVGRVRYTVFVDRFRPQSKFTFGAASDDGPSDAIRVRVPGRRHGIPWHDGRSGSVTAGRVKEEVFRLPGDRILGTLTLRLNLDAGVHSAVVGALDPLIQYPYGCIEQTMTRFLPAVAARRALGKLPPRGGKDLDAVIASGLLRIARLEDGSGSWAWWRNGRRNGALTGYVLYGLSVCKKSGVGVDGELAARAAKFLRKHLDETVFKEKGHDCARLPIPVHVDGRIFEALALAEYESAWGPPTAVTRRLVGTLAESRDLNALEEIMLSLACFRLGMNEDGERLAARVKRRPVDDVPTASFLLQLQALRGGEADAAVRFLLGARRGRAWRTTLDSAWAVLGLSALLERAPLDGYIAPGTVRIRVNGQQAGEIELPAGADPAFDGRITVTEPRQGWGEKLIVQLFFDGRGIAFYTASLEAMRGGEDPEPVSRGLKISRAYFEQTENGWRAVRTEAGAGNPMLVHLKIESSEPLDYLMLTDPRPDGFEPMHADFDELDPRQRRTMGLTDQVDLAAGWWRRLDRFRRAVRGDTTRESGWAKALLREIIVNRRFRRRTSEDSFGLFGRTRPAAFEHHDGKSIFFLDHVGRGISHVYYLVRPEFVGRFHALPPRIVPMYEPEVHGSGRESRLVVVEPTDRIPETAPLPAGVAGLLHLIDALERVDADLLIARIPSNPRVGDLIMSVASRETLRQWLAHDRAVAAEGSDLRRRIEAARRDLAVRRLAAEAMAGMPPAWMPVVEQALAEAGSASRVLEGADPGDVSGLDNVLLWATEDREYRLALLAMLQDKRKTTEIRGIKVRSVTVSEVLEALGDRAPRGEALVRWKLNQQATFPGRTIEDLVGRMARGLDLTVKIEGHGRETVPASRGRVAEILHRALVGQDLYYAVRGGTIHIAPLEEITR